MPFKENVLASLEKLMMRSTSERFGLLYQWGLEHRFIRLVDMEGTPYIVARRLDAWEMCDTLEPRIMETLLPDGIKKFHL